MKYLVTVGIEMEYGKYIPIEAPCIRKAYHMARPHADEEKGEYAFEVHYDIPEWYHESLGCSCNQTIDDAWGGNGNNRMEEYLRPLPTEEEMQDLHDSMIVAHEKELRTYGLSLLTNIVLGLEADGHKVRHVILTDIGGIGVVKYDDIWEDLKALCDCSTRWNQGGPDGSNVVWDLMHRSAEPLKRLASRAYYKSKVWCMHPRCEKEC